MGFGVQFGPEHCYWRHCGQAPPKNHIAKCTAEELNKWCPGTETHAEILQAAGLVKIYSDTTVEGPCGRGLLARLIKAVVARAYSLLKQFHAEGRGGLIGTMARHGTMDCHGCHPMTAPLIKEAASL